MFSVTLSNRKGFLSRNIGVGDLLFYFLYDEGIVFEWYFFIEFIKGRKDVGID